LPGRKSSSNSPKKQSVPFARKQAKPAKKRVANSKAGRRKSQKIAQTGPFVAKLFAASAMIDTQFSGTLYLSNQQASLDASLLVLQGVDDFGSAVSAAAQALENRGFHTDQSITVTGHTAVAHLPEHPLTVIVMSNAQPNG
jgi:hypothetical protein